MSASNKLIFSLAQTLTDDEKVQACKNIGAALLGAYPTSTGNVNVTQQMAQNGAIEFEFSDTYSQSACMFFDVVLSVPASANLGGDIFPVRIELDFTLEGGQTGYAPIATGVLCRTANNTPWKLCSTFFYNFARLSNRVTSFKITVNFKEWLIPQNTDVGYTIYRTFLE